LIIVHAIIAAVHILSRNAFLGDFLAIFLADINGQFLADFYGQF
jgi:hypothetical protein